MHKKQRHSIDLEKKRSISPFQDQKRIVPEEGVDSILSWFTCFIFNTQLYTYEFDTFKIEVLSST